MKTVKTLATQPLAICLYVALGWLLVAGWFGWPTFCALVPAALWFLAGIVWQDLVDEDVEDDEEEEPLILRAYNVHPDGTKELVWEREIVEVVPAPVVFAPGEIDPYQPFTLGDDYYGTRVDDAEE